MKQIILGIITFILLSNSFAFNNSIVQPFQLKNLTSQQSGEMNDLVQNAEFLKINEVITTQLLQEKSYAIRLEIPFTGNSTKILDLQRMEILTSKGKVVAGTDNGDKVISLRDKFVAYNGSVEGYPGSMVSLTLSPLGLQSLINLNGNIYVIGSLQNNSFFSKEDYILYQASQLKIHPEFHCESEIFNIPERIYDLMWSLDGQFNIQSSDLLEVEVALESDYETYSAFGSVENAASYLLSLFATVSAVYTHDLNVKFSIPYIRVWSTPNDPYEGEDSYTLLSQFRSYWNTNMQLVGRDLAHYLSIRPGGLGGIAWLDALCSSLVSGIGYAFSNIDGSYSGLPIYSWDVDVVAHETGHNFGSPHTHSCSWPQGPIDTCYAPEGNCYNGPIKPIKGTIMSYCHLGVGKFLRFHPTPLALIRSNAELASCVSIYNQDLILSVPNGGEIFKTQREVFIIWGTSLTGTVDLQFSADSGMTWVPIASNIPADQREYSWTTPYVPTTSNALIRILDSSNPLLADTCDAPFTIKTELETFTNYLPATNSTFTVNSGNTNPINFVWQKTGDFPGFTYRLRLFDFGNHRVYLTSNQNGSDTTLTLTAHQLDSILTVWNAFQNQDSVRIRWNVRAHFMGDSSQSFPIFYLNLKRPATAIAEIENDLIPDKFELRQNYPNPFNPTTTVGFSLPNTGFINLDVFNNIGQRIKTLVNQSKPAGFYEIQWDGFDENGNAVASGVYLLRFTVLYNDGNQNKMYQQTRKILLVR